MIELFAPDEVAARVSDIDLDALARRGIEGLVLDVDNTLLPWGSADLDAGTRRWMQRARERFSICLLSNSVRGRRMRKLARELDVPGLSAWGLRRKPFRGGVMAALRRTGTAPEHTAMIGDQLLTDVLAGNRAGLYTIWVDRISPREFVLTRFNRIFEGWLARRLDRAGLLPGPVPERLRREESERS
ncbi:MAG: YqeG family HAD IIIA-type phosphatase [Armatimonadetes bacterium]|nr:YqeG family HAD IIIA-type phosphatase [Armatimonadota bacterium]